MKAPVLDVSRYRKEYRGKVAVSDLSLSVAPGEICGFIGHNGAGKTTLIRSVVGAQPPTSGTVRVCGRDVWREPVAAKRLMAYVPDNPDVYDFLTGMQYLDLIADVFGVSGPDSACSHGMRQKLVLTGALLHDPTLLVLDEPFVGLDPSASHELKAILRERADAGGAVFFSSHVLEVVERLCDTVAVIRRGELVASGPTDEVRGSESLEDVFLELVDEGGAAPSRR